MNKIYEIVYPDRFICLVLFHALTTKRIIIETLYICFLATFYPEGMSGSGTVG